MSLTFAMLVLEVRDLRRSIDFYRLLGLDVPDPRPDRPVSICRLGHGAKLVLTESFAARYDPDWARPERGYQQLVEFYAGDDAAVDAEWARLTGAGYHGRMAPTQTAGPYAAMVDDPDGNVILLTSDEAARPDAGTA
ncbi:VOC family protein [Cellulomonas sp. SG140]|uniref:VOC family protein n=1 Tax=Cellulomonas sp. SG140 TaxID=2976536 RepID=UPI0021E83B83|nr:VOC family protein [Cellulomonas sp. SG140]